MNEHEEKHGSAKSDFMKTVEDIRLAETQSDEIKDDAKSRSDQILKKAKEDVLRIRAEIEEELVAYKNKLLQQGVSEIDDSAESILSKAKNEAERVRKTSLDKKTTEALLDEFISVI